LYNSGYCANIGLISTLAGKNDIILSDKLNHASIVDAAILSHAKVKRYPHKDMDALERFLKNSKEYSRRIIVTDGVFSMDGDIAPLKEIAALSKKYDALVIVDDAHATGVLGKNGKGTLDHLGIVSGGNIIQMGTLSKALGCFGAFVAGKRDLIEYLINRSRSFIYTTALPPSNASAAMEAVNIAKNGDALRKKLFENVRFLRDRLTAAGFHVLNSETHIIPLLIGDVEKTLDLSRCLLKHGVFIQAIRPPTVPKDTCRLRITPTAMHAKEELEHAFLKIKGWAELKR
jgi:8-amino-7-oxononanoate synthase